ncbi:MAG: hypothetical protein EBS19_16325, partial [Spirochaetia bacterium]|nr:hypothetical protein [Spirochaetia bacterium]
MKFELLIFAVTAFFIMNAYYDDKYVQMLKTWKKYALVSCAFFLLIMVLHGKEEQKLNELVLQAVASMPTGGNYSTTPTSFKNLHQALFVKKGSLVIQASSATPSFCSEATYLVFLKTIQTLQEQKKLFLEEGQLNALLPHHESDGHGFWGCWNANGPGVARLFYLWGLGPNFTDLSLAEPGDFLKIF